MKRIVSSLIFSLVSINTLIMADTGRPKLVVGIMVDQLRSDYVEYLRNLFGNNGFNRLMNQGAYFKDIDFRNTVSDPAASTAVVYTGAWPGFNGVSDSQVYDDTRKRLVPVLADSSSKGSGASEGYSPKAMVLSTISDELVIDGDGLGKIYSISADPQQAVVMTSHAGSTAAWIDDNTGKWAGSSFYNTFPQSLSALNRTSPLASRIRSMQWKPALPLSAYPGIPSQKKQFEFSYTFPASERDAYKKFKSSALVNTELTNAAISTLKEIKLGNRGEAVDMLNVAYTAAPYKFSDNKDIRLELEDTYLRLDTELGRLLDEIDRTVGLQNTFIFLSSTGYYDDASVDNEKYRIPSGEFSTLKAESLLNSYLSAIHGNGDFVSRITGDKLYLDHKLIDRKGIDPSKIREESRDFLGRMSGISQVFILEDILGNTGNRRIENLALAIDPKQAADLYLMYTPGWTVTDDTEFPPQSKVVRLGTPTTPAFILYPSVAPQQIDATVEATVLAPTISSALHIRAPNGAAEKPLNLKQSSF